MKPYPKYKDSGVPWLGEVPEHWEVKRIKEVTTVLPSNVDKVAVKGQLEVRLCNYVDVYKNEKITADIEFMVSTATDVQIERLGLEKGDVVVTKDSESPWDIAVPALVAEDIENLVCGYHLAVLKPDRVHGGFLSWALRSYPVNLHFALAAKGVTRFGLSTGGLSDGNIAVPPSGEGQATDEQTAIASYLDAETARIDILVSEKEKLVGLLREYRQSVISEAVTKGLNPNAPMKKSGVPWLGDVPEHWEVARLRFRCRLNPRVRDDLEEDDTVSFLPMEAIGDDGSIDLSRTRKAKDVSSGYTYFEDQDLTIAKITPCFENGKGAVMQDLQNGAGFGTTELIVVRPAERAHSKWLYYMTQSTSFRKRGEAMMMGAGGQKRVSDLFVKDFPMAWPSVAEQTAIAAYLDTQTAKLDGLIAHARKEIDLLRELRSATITDAVLGRIDLRPQPQKPGSPDHAGRVA